MAPLKLKLQKKVRKHVAKSNGKFSVIIYLNQLKVIQPLAAA